MFMSPFKVNNLLEMAAIECFISVLTAGSQLRATYSAGVKPIQALRTLEAIETAILSDPSVTTTNTFQIRPPDEFSFIVSLLASVTTHPLITACVPGVLGIRDKYWNGFGFMWPTEAMGAAGAGAVVVLDSSSRIISSSSGKSKSSSSGFDVGTELDDGAFRKEDWIVV